MSGRSAKRTLRRLVFPVGLALLGPLPALAQSGLDLLCPLLLFERETELDDLELAIHLDETQLKLANELYEFQDGLWKQDMTERLVYLAAKHHRDVAEVSVERAKKRLERQQALVEEYRLVCDSLAAGGNGEDRSRAIAEAHRRYLARDCEVRELDVAVIKVNLGHHQENLQSARDLRKNDIASREQVMYAERDVEMMLEELEQARKRAEHCEASAR